MRGRVMGLYMLVFAGGTPIGAPIVGWVTDTAGPRVGMLLCGVVPGLAAVAVAAAILLRTRIRPAAAEARA
jgi:MFS family permease